MADDFANEVARPGGTNWIRLLLIVVLASGFFAWLFKELQNPQAHPHPSLGKPAPAILVDGWLNGTGPTIEQVAGQVCVIDVFAYWCRPCLQSAPHTVDLYDAYKDRGVVFIGLTSEDASDAAKTEEFLKKAKFDWPCGYGASQTIARLYQSNSNPIPAMFIVDRQGKIGWVGHPLDLKSEKLDELLKQP